jgi:4-amino-4-deoxy-L-arabinose transferase-like glycosyltransferase
MRTRKTDLLIFAVYLAFLALLDVRGIEHASPDTATYVQPAESLSAGTGFAVTAPDGSHHPEFIRTPFYPLVLAGFLKLFGSAGVTASIWFHRVLWGAIVVFAFPGIGAATAKRARMLRAVGKGLCLLSPQVLVNASLAITDLPFACLVALGLHAASRMLDDASWRRAAWAGLLLGAATLTRPGGKLLPLVLALAALAWIWRRRDRRAIAAVAVFLVVTTLLPLGWSARNWYLSGHFTLSPFSGASIAWHRQALIARMARDNQTFGGLLEDRYARLVAEQDNALLALQSLKTERQLDDFETNAVAGRVGMQAVRRHPLRYTGDSLYHMINMAMAPADAQALCRVLFGYGRAIDTSLGTAVRQRVWSALLFQAIVRLGNLLAFLVLPLAVCVYAGRRGRLHLSDWLYLASAGHFVVVTSLMVSTYGRFLLPVLPTVAHFLCVRAESIGVSDTL